MMWRNNEILFQQDAAFLLLETSMGVAGYGVQITRSGSGASPLKCFALLSNSYYLLSRIYSAITDLVVYNCLV